MTRSEFSDGLEKLQLAFGWSLKREAAELFYEQLSTWTGSDWRVAVQACLDNDERFPRLATLKKHLSEAATVRRERDWGRTKAREREEIERMMKPGEEGGLWAQNHERVRKLIATLSILDRPGRQKAIQDLHDELEAGYVPGTEECFCNNGIVAYKQDEYEFIGACAKCRRGPKHISLVDPVTLAMVR